MRMSITVPLVLAGILLLDAEAMGANTCYEQIMTKNPNGFRSCKAIQSECPGSLSGIYKIKPSGKNGPTLVVYCDMDLHGGGWTFLPRSAIRDGVGQNDIDALFTDRRQVLLRILKRSGSQPYTLIKQLPGKEQYPLGLRLNNYQGYTRPLNYGQKFYLLLGILPNNVANQRTTQGFASNSKQVKFGNCDANPNSYFAFLPNHLGQGLSGYHGSNLVYERTGVAVAWRQTAVPKSGRVMPYDYFFLTEMHFGGCGCYTSSDRWTDAFGTAIGFR